VANETFELLVLSKELIADEVVRLSLARPDGAELPPWSPGAHIDLYLGPRGDLVRQYSLCGRPEDRVTWQVAVLRERESRGGSAYVHDVLSEGQRILVGGPRNQFQLVASQRYIFIAGGIGITPILPMITAVARTAADWRLLYGGRSAQTMAFTDELKALGGERVDLRPQDVHGLLDVESLLAQPQPGTVIYCCGPEALLQAVEKASAHWPPGSLHVERFAPVQDHLARPSEPFEVEFARSGVTAVVPSDKSILDVAEEHGIDISYACREGTCSSCETDVLDGIPDHRDSVLTEEERAANETMMVCVSRARTARLVIDA